MRDVVLKTRGVALSDADITSFEQAIGKTLPSDYREFLLQFNGGSNPRYSVFKIDDKRGSIAKCLYSLKPGGVPEPMGLMKSFYNPYIDPIYLEIGSDLGGNGICLCTTKEEFGAIYWHDHEAPEEEDGYESVVFVARSFTDFLHSLTDEFKWP